jgi:hypothetical protein
MKFRKKPVVINAVQWHGNNESELRSFFKQVDFSGYSFGSGLTIRTLEGVLKANVGNWIIRGVKCEFYACKPDIFEMTYEVVGE